MTRTMYSISEAFAKKNLLIYECKCNNVSRTRTQYFLCIIMRHSCFYYSIWHFLSLSNCFKNDISLCDHKLSSSKKHYHWDTNRHLQATDSAKSQFNICYFIMCHFEFANLNSVVYIKCNHNWIYVFRNPI